jgi:hypothetical protein
LWTFVQTRDAAYAVDLALAALDPTRARNSLEFKTSERREGGGGQLVQDLGTGGSYPVSSDRAAWAFGAWRLLGFLDGAERSAFIDLAWEAVRNTIEHDREVLFDATIGLYRGEQSFLDAREQSYPSWVADDPVQIHQSTSLSTNAAHLKLLELGAWLAAEKSDTARETQFQNWASGLRLAIDQVLFHTDLGLWGTFVPGALDTAPARHFDALGAALAVLGDVGEPTRRAEAVRSYPHLPKGPPVIWPQQHDPPIYHNRAQWPFVTAYLVRAARTVRNDAVVGHGVSSLMRGAALNLSNMQNFEMVSGAAFVDDGALSGPIVNSHRQLWSVAAYLSMVHDVLFGLDTTLDGIRFMPYVPRFLRSDLFADVDRLVLEDFPYRGVLITVVVNLPPVTGDVDGAYTVGEIRLNGSVIPSDYLSVGALVADNILEVDLEDIPETAGTLTLVSGSSSDRVLFAPRPPEVTGVLDSGGMLEVGFVGGGEPASEIAFNIYRDGVRVASGLPGSSSTWLDPGATTGGPSHCYTVEAVDTLSGNHSHRAKPACWWGSLFERIQIFSAETFVAVGGTFSTNYGRPHYENWGEPGHTLTLNGVTAGYTGEHMLQLTYGNGAGPVATGITCAIKRVEVVDEGDSTVAGSGLVVMPHLGTWDRWADSSLLPVALVSGRSYRVEISHDATSLNMSDLQHNELYTGGLGGASGAYHNVNIAEIKLLSRVGGP